MLSGLVFNLTKKECQVLAALIYIMNQEGATHLSKDIKKKLADFSNFNYQVVTNYCNVLKRKKVINPDGTLHSIFNHNKIVISYESEDIL